MAKTTQGGTDRSPSPETLVERLRAMAHRLDWNEVVVSTDVDIMLEAADALAALSQVEASREAQGWQPIATAPPDQTVILRPHRIWGAMDVSRMSDAQRETMTGILSRDADWRWLNGDHTTAWTEDAFLPFWMPRPTLPSPPETAHE